MIHYGVAIFAFDGAFFAAWAFIQLIEAEYKVTFRQSVIIFLSAYVISFLVYYFILLYSLAK